MADATVHKQEILIKDISTRSVTLYPARANIVRDINDVCLRPGANEISIYGLTPTADEHSIKVDGKGIATITDMTVDLVPNREIFEDVYPSDSEVSDSESDSEGDEDEIEAAKKEEAEAVKEVTAQLDALKSSLEDARERQNNASKTTEILGHYGASVDSDSTKSSDISPTLQACFSERQRLYEIWKECKTSISELEKEIEAKTKEKSKLEKPYRKLVAKATSKKRKLRKLRVKKERQRREKRKEKALLKEERMKFWPKKVYRVILHLDAPSLSSRRDSLADPKKPLSPASAGSATSDQLISLSLSYITYSASWSPRYDLLLTTPTSSGTIVYRASFKNTTSETWRDAKIVLSTSQTSYQGLGETVPHMAPWHVSLAKGGGGAKSSFYNNKSGPPLFGGSGDSSNAAWGGGLYSIAEQSQMKPQGKIGGPQQNVNRSDLFGVGDNKYKSEPLYRQQPQRQQPQGQQQQSSQQHSFQSNTTRGGLFGSSSAGFGGPAPAESGPPPGGYTVPARVRVGVDVVDDGIGGGAPSWRDDDATATIAPDPTMLESLDFQESSHEDYGMTTTYDVPGLRMLPPSDLTRRHKIAEVPLHGVQLSYILVPKLRPAAFLKARIRNSSLITLLRGQAGLTLDGTFLGNTWLPRCSPGETFSLPLGVDPAVHVSYAKPTVRRSSSGVFTKEDVVVYTRICWITNTKPSAVVDLRVLDQAPVSEDERLRIAILLPKGLKSEGDSVRAGVDSASSSAAGGTGDGDEVSVRSSIVGSVKGRNVDGWGRAVASLKKGGEVSWDVKLNGGKGCKLALEYEARIPGSESIVGIDSAK
ncbi:MAG: hypothetical protein M1813_002136 [Trichoglossum hirsutum]|nr:MAG: hypothetical protein M1813_002136 [Trichoglossum hirsutum]